MQRTPLYDRHVALGARMVGFGGWEMPVQYAGVLAEHEAVRRRAGLFDVSHMGEIFISGPQSMEFVNRIQTNNVSKMAAGQVLYSVMCGDKGSAIDDLLVYCMGPQSWMLIVNASNCEKDHAWIVGHLGGMNATVQNRSADFGLLALQGPKAAGIAAAVLDFPRDLKYYHFALSSFEGAEVIVSRTGYTGEDGVELMVPTAKTAALWDTLMAVGKVEGIAPCGLAARDLLRIEAGYSLYGHELDTDIDPLTAGLRWVVKMDHEFIGKEALEGLIPARRKIAFTLEGKNIPRQGFGLLAGGAPAGAVTSGTFSPSLQKPIGIGYIAADKGVAPGGTIAVDIRGKQVPAQVCRLPFINPGVFK